VIFPWHRILAPDWLDAELMIVVAMAMAGVWVMVAEARAHRRESDERIHLHARLASVETAIAASYPSTLAERVAALEVAVYSTSADIRERLAVVEARLDHRPHTQTRRKDGKFGAPLPSEPAP